MLPRKILDHVAHEGNTSDAGRRIAYSGCMRFAYILAAVALCALAGGCGDDDYGADGPSVSYDFSATVNADLSPDLTPVDLATD